MIFFFFHDCFESIFFPAGNGFTDDDAKYFADALSVSYPLFPAFSHITTHFSHFYIHKLFFLLLAPVTLLYCYIQTNSRLKVLDLSHNEFCGKGGEHLGQLLGMVKGFNRSKTSS